MLQLRGVNRLLITKINCCSLLQQILILNTLFLPLNSLNLSKEENYSDYQGNFLLFFFSQILVQRDLCQSHLGVSVSTGAM